jgi:hypothetical protein
VVIGPYPPSPDPAADAVLATVRALRAAGDTVTVVSSEPSAAPVHGDPSRPVGAARAARVVRGADRVVWYAPDGVTAARPLRRALATVATVERRRLPARPDDEPTRRSWGARVRRVRAGAPTFVRTAARRLRRA